MVKTAGGVVSEARFSGLNRQPNRYQGYWTYFNTMADAGNDLADLDVQPVTSMPDYYIYELVKNSNLNLTELAKFLRTTPAEIQAILSRHTEIEARLGMVRDELYQGVLNEMYETV